MQCARRCHDKLYPSEELLHRLNASIVDGKLTKELVPRCPVCGGVMEPWVKSFIFQYGSYWEEQAEKMVQSEQNGKICPELVPKCPCCGGTMQVHLQLDQNFIPNYVQQQKYSSFLEKYHDKRLVILELGIGWRNQLIKAPFMRLAAQEAKATYVTINLGEIYIPENIRNKSFGLDGYLSDILKEIRKEQEK